MFGLDALTHVQVPTLPSTAACRPGHHTKRHARASVVSRPKYPPSGVLRQHAKAIAARQAVEQPVAADEGGRDAHVAWRGMLVDASSLGPCACAVATRGPRTDLEGVHRANRGREVSV